jgi:DNA-binding HxlR family transcriptional regulator
MYRQNFEVSMDPHDRRALDGAADRAVALQAVSEIASECPTRRIMDIIGAKWTLGILAYLRGQPMRNAELLAALDGVSQRVLTETLRHLERDGLVARDDRPGFPRFVEYSVTPLGRSLAEAFGALNRWVDVHGHEVTRARRAFEGEAGATGTR